MTVGDFNNGIGSVVEPCNNAALHARIFGAISAVTVRFVLNDDTITGEMLNPAPVEFDSITFDSDSLSLVAEAESADHGHVLMKARIEDVTQLNGTWTHGDRTGAVWLTTWTDE